MDRPRRAVLVLCLGLPLSILAGSYLWLAAVHGTAALAGVVVHESGAYTLTQTLLYFPHFLREIPVDVVMALFTVAAFERVSGRFERIPRALGVGCAIVAVALAVAAFAITVRHDGAASARLDLLQFRTTDDNVAYGSHWHYHFASTLWFGFGASLALRLVAAIAGMRLAARDRAQWAPWVAVLVLTAVFGVSPLALTSVRYTGHQARELMTHVPVTLPLVFAALAAVSRLSPERAAKSTWLGRIARALAERPWQAVGAFAIPLMLAAVTLSGNPLEEGQAEQGLAAMVAGHVFEHALDYVFTVTFAVAAAALVRLRSDASPPPKRI
jgi:hypothetical protein